MIARFDADSLVDYRAHRPRMTFSGDRYESFAAPEILLYALEDDAGVPFLLLHGAEPDYAWERFVAAVAAAGRAARRHLGRGPAGHPDARAAHPAGHRHRARDPAALIDSYPVYWGEMRIPGSVSALLELRLGEAGVDALGVAAHVPHYLAQATYPAASLTLLEHLEQLTGLHLPIEGLREAAEANRTEIDEQIGRSPENTAVVAALEQQYDSFAAAREGTGPARRDRRGAQRRGDRRGVRALPGRPGPQAPPRLNAQRAATIPVAARRQGVRELRSRRRPARSARSASSSGRSTSRGPFLPRLAARCSSSSVSVWRLQRLQVRGRRPR